jgi:hypothetical protein
METLTKNQKLKLIKTAYSLLDVLNNVRWTAHRDDLLKLCKEEEKHHRGMTGNEYKLTIDEAAKLFVVYRVAQYLARVIAEPVAKDFIVMQKSAFYAASLVANYRTEIETAWQGVDLEQLCALDYADMVQN